MDKLFKMPGWDLAVAGLSVMLAFSAGCATTPPPPAAPLPTLGSIEVESVRRLRLEPNPKGLQLGFWANFDQSNAVLRDFGLRPIERVDFTKWEQIERAPGKYTIPNLNGIKDAHLSGSTVVANINIIFSTEVQKAVGSAIPKFYPQRISHPETREAAKKFLRAYVGWLLEQTGSVWLCLDYEFMYFYLPISPEIRQEYRDWYVEATALVREEATRRGMAGQVKLIPIANSDMRKNAERFLASPFENHQRAQWLVDVVAASDALGIDSYAADPGNPASAARAFGNIEFWLKYYADPKKPFFVTENGFSSVAEAIPDYPEGGHLQGTEAEQLRYFQEVFDRMLAYNASAGAGPRIDGYCVWMYKDFEPPKEKFEHYLGVVRKDGSRKPAFHAVKSFYDKVEADPALSPWRRTGTDDVKADWQQGRPIPMTYASGTEHDVLELTCRLPEGTRGVKIDAELATPGGIVADLNGAVWNGTRRNEVGRALSLVLDGGAKAGQNNTIRLRFTDIKFPVSQELRSLKLSAVK